MADLHELENALPVDPLCLVVLDSARTLGNDVNKHLVELRKKEKRCLS